MPPKGTENSKASETGQEPIKLPQRKSATGKDKTPVSWKTLGVAVVVVGVLLQTLWYLKRIRKEGKWSILLVLWWWILWTMPCSLLKISSIFRNRKEKSSQYRKSSYWGRLRANRQCKETCYQQRFPWQMGTYIFWIYSLPWYLSWRTWENGTGCG